MPEMTEAYEWQGRTVVGSDGEKIGKVAEIYLDGETNKPEWATVTTGLFGTKSNFVPLAGASPDGEDIRVDVTKDQVKDAPGVDPDGELSEHEESRLFEHYGVPYTREGSVTAQGQPTQGTGIGTETDEHTDVSGSYAGERAETDHPQEGRDTSGPTTDDAMTRSEEELHVGTRQRESGRVRLRKYVVTEMATQTVPVQREEVRVEREPITDENRGAAEDGPAISEEEHEVVLHAEEPVVEKRVEAKERVRLGTETVSEEHEVSEEVRKEQIETDGADQPGTGARSGR
jgi:uncharacterized protein (TIGR02271 family)